MRSVEVPFSLISWKSDIRFSGSGAFSLLSRSVRTTECDIEGYSREFQLRPA